MKPEALRAGISASDAAMTLGIAPAMAKEHLLAAESNGMLYQKVWQIVVILGTLITFQCHCQVCFVGILAPMVSDFLLISFQRSIWMTYTCKTTLHFPF